MRSGVRDGRDRIDMWEIVEEADGDIARKASEAANSGIK